jgi:hypothetical protein
VIYCEKEWLSTRKLWLSPNGVEVYLTSSLLCTVHVLITVAKYYCMIPWRLQKGSWHFTDLVGTSNFPRQPTISYLIMAATGTETTASSTNLHTSAKIWKLALATMSTTQMVARVWGFLLSFYNSHNFPHNE